MSDDRAGRLRLGLYGGTFDPVHLGHLILARTAVETLGLDRLVLIPNVISPHKQQTSPTPPEVRLAMLRAAVEGEPLLEVSDVELQRGGPSFAIDTVEHFRVTAPDAEIFYLIGADNLPALDTWHRIGELRAQARFVVLTREAGPRLGEFPEIDRRIDISATDIRARVAKGRSIRYLVPETVRSLIERHRLYREPHH